MTSSSVKLAGGGPSRWLLRLAINGLLVVLTVLVIKNYNVIERMVPSWHSSTGPQQPIFDEFSWEPIERFNVEENLKYGWVAVMAIIVVIATLMAS